MAEQKPARRPDRRQVLSALAGTGVIGIAGCMSDAGGDGDGGDGGPGFEIFLTPPQPRQSQHNVYAVSLATIADLCRHPLAYISAIDNQPVPDLANDWTYEAGVLDLQLHEDFYWWDDTNVTVEDLSTTLALDEYVFSESPNPHIDAVERNGDHAVTFRLTESFRETPAVVRTVVGETPLPHAVYGEWLERFEDASTQDEIDDVAIELSGTKMTDNIRSMYNVPFVITNVGEFDWEFTLRTDVDPTPHYVDDIEIERVVASVSGQNTRERFQFTDGKAPYSDLSTLLDADVSFEAPIVELPQPASPGAYIFNCAREPTKSAHFRRAFAYMLNRHRHSPAEVQPDQVPTGFTSRSAEQSYFGTLFENFEDYGPDSVLEEKASAEMEAGGFERNSAGKWLYRSGPREGEPITFTVTHSNVMNAFGQLSDPFASAMTEFGIEISYDTIGDVEKVFDQLAAGNFDLALSFWGGNQPLPSSVYRLAFLGESSAHGNSQYPAEWEGPPIGDADASESQTYAVESAVQQLDLVADDTRYEELLRRLGWVYNQGLPKLPIGSYQNRYRLNAEEWDWQLPAEDNPDAWLQAGLDATTWTMGLVSPSADTTQ